MSYHQRPHELRLAISSEAEALFSDFGGEAYAEACRRASEASSDSLARDWSVVAATIALQCGTVLRHPAALVQVAKGKVAASVGSIAIGGMVCSSLTLAGVLYPCRATSQVSL